MAEMKEGQEAGEAAPTAAMKFLKFSAASLYDQSFKSKIWWWWST